MDLPFPSFHFNHDLHEVPDSIEKFSLFIEKIKQQLVYASLHQQGSLLSQLGVAYRILKQLDLAENYLVQALSCAEQENDKMIIFTAKLRLAHCFQWQKKFELSNAIFEELQKEVENHSIPQRLHAFFWQHKGKNVFDQNQFQDALIYFEIALKIRLDKNEPQELIKSSQFAINETKKRLVKF